MSDSNGAAQARRRACADSFGSPATIGRLFLTDHLLAFEAISLVLLVGADRRRRARRRRPAAGPHSRRARRARAEAGALRPASRVPPPRGSGRARERGGHVTPGHRLLDHALVGALLHRPGRRDAAPQPDRDPALARDHAQRGQPAARRRLALRRRQRRPRARAHGHGESRPPRSSSGSAWSWRSRAAAPRSTSTSCGACTDERRRLRLARPAHAADRPRLQHRRRAERLAARRGLGGLALDPGRLRALAARLHRPALPRRLPARDRLDGLALALGRQLPGRREHPRRPALDRDAARDHRRRLPDPRLLRRLHARRHRGEAVLRLPQPVRVLDAAARAGRATSCSCSPAGGSSASPRTC